MICYWWAWGSSHTQLYPHYMAHILWFWLTCEVKMMSLCHGWGWQPLQTASHIHLRHIQSVWTHWYAVHGHMAVALNSYTHSTWVRLLWSWVTCGVKMMSLHHGWGWQPTQTASFIHIRRFKKCLSTLIYCFWAYSSSLKQLYPHYLGQILVFWSLVESKWCHYVLVETDSQLKLLPASTSYIYTVFEHIDMLSMGIWQ